MTNIEKKERLGELLPNICRIIIKLAIILIIMYYIISCNQENMSLIEKCDSFISESKSIWEALFIPIILYGFLSTIWFLTTRLGFLKALIGFAIYAGIAAFLFERESIYAQLVSKVILFLLTFAIPISDIVTIIRFIAILFTPAIKVDPQEYWRQQRDQREEEYTKLFEEWERQARSRWEQEKKEQENYNWQQQSYREQQEEDELDMAFIHMGFSPNNKPTEEEFNKRRTRLLKENHPDNGGSVEKCQEINHLADICKKYYKDTKKN